MWGLILLKGIERQVEVLKVVPLWALAALVPVHNIISNMVPLAAMALTSNWHLIQGAAMGCEKSNKYLKNIFDMLELGILSVVHIWPLPTLVHLIIIHMDPLIAAIAMVILHLVGVLKVVPFQGTSVG